MRIASPCRRCASQLDRTAAAGSSTDQHIGAKHGVYVRSLVSRFLPRNNSASIHCRIKTAVAYLFPNTLHVQLLLFITISLVLVVHGSILFVCVFLS